MFGKPSSSKCSVRCADTGRTDDVEVGGAAFVPGVEQKKGQAEEMVAVEVADQDDVDVVGAAQTALLELLQHRGTAVEEVATVEQEGAEGASLGGEGVTGAEEEQVERRRCGRRLLEQRVAGNSVPTRRWSNGG